MYNCSWKPLPFASVNSCFEYFQSHYVVAVTTVISGGIPPGKKYGLEEANDGGKEAARERL